MSWSVIPPRALTTTTIGCRRASFSTIRFKLRMLFTEPTDVPPNFKTFICLLFVMLYHHPIYKMAMMVFSAAKVIMFSFFRKDLSIILPSKPTKQTICHKYQHFNATTHTCRGAALPIANHAMTIRQSPHAHAAKERRRCDKSFMALRQSFWGKATKLLGQGDKSVKARRQKLCRKTPVLRRPCHCNTNKKRWRRKRNAPTPPTACVSLFTCSPRLSLVLPSKQREVDVTFGVCLQVDKQRVSRTHGGV